MNRRALVQRLVGAGLGTVAGVWGGNHLAPDPVKVETLEHDVKTGKSFYVTRWTFNTEKEAVQWVRSLLPELTEVTFRRSSKVASIRSGYRGAVRVQYRDEEILKTDWTITSSTGKLVLEYPKFPLPVLWDAAVAWGWLSNIRVNGKVVDRTVAENGKPCFNQYLSHPFKKGNPKFTYVGKKDKEMDPTTNPGKAIAQG